MPLTICCVRDSAAQAYNAPIFVPNAAIAVRSLKDEVNRNSDNNQLFRHPEDFELYELGFYDDATARMELHEQPKLIARAKDLKDPT